MPYLLDYSKWRSLYEEKEAASILGIPLFEGVRDDLQAIVSKLKETDDPSVKSHPEYSHMMEWFQTAGKPAGRSKEANEVITTPDDMYQSMTYWQGDLTKKVESSTRVDELILKLEPWTNLETVKSNLEWLRKQDNKTTEFRPSELSSPSNYLASNGSKIPFSKPWIKGSLDEAAAIISKRATEIKGIFSAMLKEGKKPGAPVNPSDPKSTATYSIGLVEWSSTDSVYSERSIGAVPFGDPEVSGWDFKGIDTKNKIDSSGNRRKWGYWLSILCTDAAFSDLKNKLTSPKYIVAKSIPITTEDKIALLNSIQEKAKKYGKLVIDASIIKIKPAKAIESRSTTTVKGEDKVTTTTEEINYSFPFSKDATQADAIAKTMFDNDSAIIKDNINAQLSQAIDEMMKAIGEVGELVSLEYRTIASTSDEPSAYIRPNKKGTTVSSQANVPLAEDRAAAIESAFLSLAGQKGIDSAKIKKGSSVLWPNNTMKGTVVYEKMKGMRQKYGGTPQQEAEYKKLFAEPKFSGIAFKAQVKKTNTTIEPTEQKVEDYSVKGNWGISISWSAKTKFGTTHASKYRGKIDWNKVFPVMGTGGGGPSVKELCAAYGG